MKLLKTEIDGVYTIENFQAEDIRGRFVKTYHKGFFLENNLCSEFKESYYSVNNKNVVRGMHFQVTPFEHEKLVYVPQGKIIDVILDLRKKSSTYGKSISVELSAKNRKSIYIPKGLAHGFKSLEDNTITVYNVSTVYNQESDFGIKWDSFCFDWGKEKLIMSKRDKQFLTFEEFKEKNPF